MTREPLEDRLRLLAKAGELSYLSVVPVAGKGDGGVVFAATYSPASKWGHGNGWHADPVEAIHLAIDDKVTKAMLKKVAKPAEPEEWLK